VEALSQPSLLVVSGLPGTGKTRIAEALSKRFELPVFSIAWILGGLSRFGVLDHPDRGAMAYEIITSLVEHRLRLGRAAICDGMVGSAELRARWAELCAQYGGELTVIECVCSDSELHRARISRRRERIPGWPDPDWDHAEAMRERYEPWARDRLVLDSADPYEANLQTAIRFLA
jgi:predicted kinase